MKEIISSEPYLVLSILFLCLRIFVSVFPKVILRLRAFWASYVPHLNLKICGETSQVIMGRIPQVIDVRRIWAKLRLSKARSFHERARSARVWASSLASVSLGESSSARSSSQGLNWQSYTCNFEGSKRVYWSDNIQSCSEAGEHLVPLLSFSLILLLVLIAECCLCLSWDLGGSEH